MDNQQHTKTTQINASSMADIAFLLLTFFMVTTVMNEEKGLTLMLPPLAETPPAPIHDRNLYAIQLNSANQLMAEGEVTHDLPALKEDIKTFLLNYGKNPGLSDSPIQAVISLKADRGTSHQAFIDVLDQIQGAYFEIYADRAGMTPKEFRELDVRKTKDKILYEKGRKDFPMNISIAEPTRVSQ